MGRVHGVAVIDVAGTIVGGAIVGRWTGIGTLAGVIFAFALGFAAHKALGIETALQKK